MVEVNKGSVTESSLRYALKYNMPVLLVGFPDPGIVEYIAADFDWPCETVNVAACVPTDLQGVPVVFSDPNGVDFFPPTLLSRLAQYSGPSVLCFTEIEAALPTVRRLCWQIATERRSGDFEISPQVRIVVALHAPSESGFVLGASLSNRFLHIEWSEDSTPNTPTP